MRHRQNPQPRRRRMPFALSDRAQRPQRGAVHDPERFEVQKRDDTGLVASVVFATERQALAFAESLSHLMARTGEKGSVQVVWPHARPTA